MNLRTLKWATWDKI